MGVSVSTGGKSGRKSLSADLNLVPYIDLLTCMVSFLLITAAWTQLARLSANQKGTGQAGEETPPVAVVNIVVVVTQESFNLVVGQEQTPIPKKGDQYDFEKLTVELKKVKEAHPEKNDVKVASEDQIKFDTLVRTMDVALNSNFPDISLIDTGAAGIRSDLTMPIHAPHSLLYSSVKLDSVKGKLGHGGRKSLYENLNLVAYIDMMTMLVIFLLMSFSATGEILFVQKNIVLPEAQNWTDLERAPVIAISADVVTLNGQQMATMDQLMQESAGGDFKITELHDVLVTLKNNYKLLHPTEDFNGIAIIQSDKNIEFKALRKVMFTAQVAGYNNVNFAVQSRAKGGTTATQ